MNQTEQILAAIAVTILGLAFVVAAVGWDIADAIREVSG